MIEISVIQHPSSSSLAATNFHEFTKKITFSKSFSLTYINKKSVSFSISNVISNTYEMSYDYEMGTYTLIISQTNYYSYFPYIIYYLSPMYVEQNVLFDIDIKKTISPEQLIGVVCGTVSVFFLILEIIILAIKRKNENRIKYDEYYDYSYSTCDFEMMKNNKETVNNNNYDENIEINNILHNEYSEVWI